MNNNLRKLYTSLLSYGSIYANMDGEMIAKFGEAEVPATIDGVPLYLPTKEILSDSEGVKVFHILSEHPARPNTPQMAYFIDAVNLSLNYRYGALLTDIIRVCASPALHASIKSTIGRELLSIGKDFTDATAVRFTKLRLSDKYDFVRMYIKKNGHIGKTGYRRLCVVQLPLLDAILTSDDALAGFAFNKKETVALEKLVKVTFPLYTGADDNGYTIGSNEELAASTDALIGGLVSLVDRFNLLADAIKNHLTDPSIIYNTDVINAELDLNDYVKDINIIPRQDYLPPVVAAPAPVTLGVPSSPLNNQMPFVVPQVNNFNPGMNNFIQPPVQAVEPSAPGTISMSAIIQSNPMAAQMFQQQQYGNMMMQNQNMPQVNGLSAYQQQGNIFDPVRNAPVNNGWGNNNNFGGNNLNNI